MRSERRKLAWWRELPRAVAPGPRLFGLTSTTLDVNIFSRQDSFYGPSIRSKATSYSESSRFKEISEFLPSVAF